MPHETPVIVPTALYTGPQLSILLDASEQTLAAARRAGALRAAKKGRRVLFLGEWVLDWLRTPEGVPSVRR